MRAVRVNGVGMAGTAPCIESINRSCPAVSHQSIIIVDRISEPSLHLTMCHHITATTSALEISARAL